MRLDGRIVIVTGGSSGFGCATAARVVAEEGANVVIADLDEPGGEESVALVEKAGGEAELVVGDIATEAGARAVVAGHSSGSAPSTSWSTTQASLLGRRWTAGTQRRRAGSCDRVNLKTVYLCSWAAIPVMIANGRGSIVNMASIAATWRR